MGRLFSPAQSGHTRIQLELGRRGPRGLLLAMRRLGYACGGACFKIAFTATATYGRASTRVAK